MRSILFLPVFGLLITTSVFSQRYELVWSDEFNAEEVDFNTWTPWYGTAYNNEHQFYTGRDTNITVNNGYLHLIGLRENFEGRNWTSGRIKSQHNADFLYGRFEIRAKLPAGKGLWPAFWLMPTNSEYGSWPYSGEIDIMEYRGHQTNRTQGTIHFSEVAYPGSGSANADREYMSGEYIIEEGDLSEEFHIYSIEWTDTDMTWYLNDTEFFHLTREEIEDRAEIYPFDKEFYIILNLAIGGNYLGNEQPDETTPDRNEVIVDYVRVYQDMNQNPEIQLSYEDTVRVVPNESITLEAVVTDPDISGSIDLVEFYIGNEQIASFTEEPYSYSWTHPIDGCYPFHVRAVDNDNGSTESGPHTILEVGTGCTRRPFENTTSTFPGILELEHYDYGGQNVSYLDFSEFSNSGNVLRTTEAVDIAVDPNDSDNYILTDGEDGEWTRYTIEVTEPGIYDFELRAVPGTGNGRVDLFLDGEDWIYFTRIGSTNDPYVYKSRTDIELHAGTYDLQVKLTQANIQPDRIKGTLVGSITSNEEPLNGIPAQIKVYQNYPNPFNPTTNISFDLPEPSSVVLEVYNNLGQHITTIVEGNLRAGTHTYTFDATSLSSGIYFYKLKAVDSYLFTGKMLLLK
ncbi:MAG: family 16 glycosylhydrolase [Balneolales bacterium]|nr:family 16 glycosylhydrolase [Balneolales bacterium]